MSFPIHHQTSLYHSALHKLFSRKSEDWPSSW